MSVTNNKAPESIFDKQDSNKLKERQRLEELKRQTKIQQVKLDKRLNKQKILMGAFLGQVLATKGDDEQMIREYFAIHFPDFLTRKSDKFLFKSMIESLGGDIGLGDEEDSFEIQQKEKSQKAIHDEAVYVWVQRQLDAGLVIDDYTLSTLETAFIELVTAHTDQAA